MVAWPSGVKATPSSLVLAAKFLKTNGLLRDNSASVDANCIVSAVPVKAEPAVWSDVGTERPS